MDAVGSKVGDAVAGGPSPLPDERILELLPTAVCVCDAEGLILRYNRKAAEIWGRSPLPGDPGQRFCGAYRLLQADGRPLAGRQTPMAEVLRTGNPERDLELLVERPGGRRLAILMDIEPVRTEAGELAGAIGSFKETGRHLKALEPRADGWEPFRTIVDTTARTKAAACA
jgi:PAS domain-containing protein